MLSAKGEWARVIAKWVVGLAFPSFLWSTVGTVPCLGTQKLEQRRLWDEYVALAGRARPATDVFAVNVSTVVGPAGSHEIIVSDPGFRVSGSNETCPASVQTTAPDGKLWILDDRLSKARSLTAPEGHTRFGQWHHAETYDSIRVVVVASEFEGSLFVTRWIADGDAFVPESSVAVAPQGSTILDVLIVRSSAQPSNVPAMTRLLVQDVRALRIVDVCHAPDVSELHTVAQMEMDESCAQRLAVVVEDCDGDGIRDVVVGAGCTLSGRNSSDDTSFLVVHSGRDLSPMATVHIDRGDPSIAFGQADVRLLELYASSLDPSHVYLALVQSGCPASADLRREAEEQIHRIRILGEGAHDSPRRRLLSQSSIVSVRPARADVAALAVSATSSSRNGSSPRATWGCRLALTAEVGRIESIALLISNPWASNITRWQVSSGERKAHARSIFAPEFERYYELKRNAWGNSPGFGSRIAEYVDADSDGRTDLLVIDFEPRYPPPALNTLHGPYAGGLRISTLSGETFDCIRHISLD